MSARRVLSAAALALVAAACVAPGATVEEPGDGGGLEQPTFDPLGTGSEDDGLDARADSPTRADPAGTATTPTATHRVTQTPGAAPTDDAPSPAQPSGSPATTAPGRVPVRGSITDGTDDLAGLHANGAPAHADLRRIDLVMGTTGSITIAFAGPAPETVEGDRVLNVATYHDVTGDGRVDYELWASLTAGGWGTAWYDIRAGTARFAADDDVEVEVVDGRVVLTFPTGHLGDARSGQWLASSEWGTVATIAAGTSTTDDAPDDRSGRPWPS